MSYYLLTLLDCKLGGKRGQGMTEYALILGLVVVIGVGVLGTDNPIKTGITGLFNSVSTKLGTIGTSITK